MYYKIRDTNKIKKLTSREKETAKLLIKGYNNREIAKNLIVSIHTVKCHVTSIINKLEALNRTHAAYIIGHKNLDKEF